LDVFFASVKIFFLDVYFRDGNLFSWKRTADLTSLLGDAGGRRWVTESARDRPLSQLFIFETYSLFAVLNILSLLSPKISRRKLHLEKVKSIAQS
jgi:hypothetical protein